MGKTSTQLMQRYKTNNLVQEKVRKKEKKRGGGNDGSIIKQ